MKKLLLLFCSCIILSISYAQDECNEMNTTYIRLDSIAKAAVLKTEVGKFAKDSIFTLGKTFELFNTKNHLNRNPMLTTMGALAIFYFDETAQPNIQALLEMCIERLVTKEKLYLKYDKANENGFKKVWVYQSKKSKKLILVLDRGTKINISSENEKNKLSMRLYWDYYLPETKN